MRSPLHRVSSALVFAAIASGLCGSAPAFGQGTFYYGGGTRTWSNTLSWWQNYQATLQALNAPGAGDSAVFNTSGSNAAGTVVFDADASVAGLRLLATATGGLTLRGDGVANRTLTLGAGGIRTLTSNSSALTIGSAAANQGLSVVLGAGQEWRRRTGNVVVNNGIAGTAASNASQTLAILTPLATGTVIGNISDGANGGRTNLWVHASNFITGTANTFTGTLTLQRTDYVSQYGGGFLFNVDAPTAAGTLQVSELQFAGMGLGINSNSQKITLTGSNTIRMLGGVTNLGYNRTYIDQAGTLVREKGGGFLTQAEPLRTGVVNNFGSIPSATTPLIPWAFGFNGTPAYFSNGGLAASNWGAPAGAWSGGYSSFSQNTNPAISVSQWTQFVRTVGVTVPGFDGPVEYLTNDTTGFLWNMVTMQIDVNSQQWTASQISSGSPLKMVSSGGGGGILIGSLGELTVPVGAATVELAVPIRESSPGGWVTYGALNFYTTAGTGLLILSGSNSHSGGTSIVSGSANINHAYALGSGTFRLNGQSIVLDNTTTGPLTIATNNFNEWNTDFTFAGTQDLNLGTGTVSLGTWAGRIRNVTVNAGNLTVGGRIVDGTYADLPTTGFSKDGNGTLILSGSNGYTGATEAWGGELRFANRSALYGGGTAAWTAANITTGSGGILSVSVGSGPGAFTSGDLDTLAGLGTDTGGFQSGGYLGIDTTNVSGTYTYATSLANPNGGANALGIAKTGAGTLVLSGVNTFTGGVMARGGRLLITGTAQVGSGPLVAAGGLLDLNGLTVSNSFSITSGTIANTTIAANKLTAAVIGPAVISGTLTGAGAQGNLTKSGTGTLVLTAANTYTGTTTLSGGLVSIASDDNIGGTAAPLAFNGGGLQVTGTTLASLATNRTTTFANNQPVAFEIVDPANTFTVSQNLQMGSGGLTKSGSGALVVSGNNTYTGATTLTGGTLRMGSSTALGSGAVLTVSGGVLDLNGNAVSRSGTVMFAGGLVTGGTLTATGVDFQGLSGTVSASLAGTRGLVKSGTGVLVLSGSNSYSGVTTVNSGSGSGFVQFATTAALYGGTTGSWTKTNITVNSDIPSGGNNGTVSRISGVLAVNVGGAGEFSQSDVTTLLTGISGTVNNNGLRRGSSIGFDTTNAGGSFTLADTIADTAGTGGGSVGLVKLGTGALILSASNTFTGPTSVGSYNGPSAGTLQLASTGFVSPTVVVYGGTFDSGGQNRTITTLSLGGGAAGSAASLQTGSGTATLGSGGVTYVAVNSPNGATIGGNLALGGTRSFLVNDSPAAAADLTVSAVIANGTATGVLTKTGFGTLALTGSNTFTGKTVISQGAVQIDWINNSGASPLGTSGTVDLGLGLVNGTLRWVGTTSVTTSRVFSLSGSAGGGGTIEASGAGALVVTSTVTAVVGSKTLTLGGTSTAANAIGAITNPATSGVLSVVKDGPGLWRLAATSDFSGSFTVKNGTVVAAVNAGSSGDPGAFGGGSNNIPFVGDTAAGATGTAALLADGVTIRGAKVTALGVGATQAVLIGGAGGSGTATFATGENLDLGRNVALVAATGGVLSFAGNWRDGTGSGTPAVDVAIGAAGYAGTVRLSTSGTLATTGAVAVRYGTAVLGANTILDGAGTLTVDAPATLGGIGRVAGPLGGAGLVSPGNSPGIMTAEAVDPTGGLDWAFEFTGVAPSYTSASASVNDVLRLTGSTPFTAGLTAGNVVSLYLSGSAAGDVGDVYQGGFFTDITSSQFATFQSLVSSGSFVAYYQSGTGGHTYNGQTYALLSDLGRQVQVGVATVPTAGFDGGASTVANGQVTTFTVVVPEPAAVVLAAIGLGLVGWHVHRRRLRSPGRRGGEFPERAA